MIEPAKFKLIYADPNWEYQNWTEAKNGAAVSAYACSSTEAIARVPVHSFADKDAMLAMWCTGPKVATGDHVKVAQAWGFEPITMCPWVKTVPRSEDISVGIGFWFQGAAEYLVICRRGHAKTKKEAPKVMGLLVGEEPVFYAPKKRHSQKPLSLIEWLEAKCDGPYLELYARDRRQGWTCWGLELGQELGPWGVREVEKAAEAK